MIRRRGGEHGSAALEFLAVAVLLLVPLVYLVIALGAVQSAMLATSAAARAVVQVVTTSPDGSVPDAVALAVSDFGIDPAAVSTRVECDDVDCVRRSSTVRATVSTEVPLPFVPAVFGLDRAVVLPVQATAAGRIERFGAPR